MSIKIGHASIDENKSARNGQAGDQTGKEVCIREWYSKPWSILLRPVDSVLADKAVSTCIKLCGSNLVGYDQNQRNTLHTQLKKFNYNVDDYINSGIKTETDCSAYMTLCYIVAGITALDYDGNAPTTSTMSKVFKNTGRFKVLTDSKYLTSDTYLKKGDILVKSGSHTVMVLEDGDYIKSLTNSSNDVVRKSEEKYKVAKFKDSSIAGTYETSANLNIREGAGVSNKIFVTAPKGSRVKCYGYYNIDNDVRWYLIQVNVKGVLYTGYASSKYLIRF